MRSILFASVSVFLLVSSPMGAAQSNALTFDAVMSTLAQSRGFVAHFREEKSIGILAAPLRSEGTLTFSPPNHLARRITRPQSNALIIEGDHVRMFDGRRVRDLDATREPAVGTFVHAFVQLLAGNRTEIERAFVVTFSAGENESWEARLAPRDTRVARIVREIRASGSGNRLSTLTVTEANGDTSTTTIDSFEARVVRADDAAFQLARP